MRNYFYSIFTMLVLIVVFDLNGAVINVSKDGTGNYTTVQTAVNASKPGDTIIIRDYSIYKEQVIIDSKHSKITIRSQNPAGSKKPVIQWQDIVNVHPKTYAESQDSNKINFDRNGAIQILRANGIVIDGIAVDGVEPYVFGYPKIWNNTDDLVHGNGGIAVWISGDAIIRNCDIRNCYIGINIKDRNEGGIFANANPADIAPWKVVPFSGFGKTGNHLIERNRIHDNSWGVFFESAWDLGSTVRYNLFYENHHYSEAFAEKVYNIVNSEGHNQTGGAIFLKDILLSPLSIHNNTFWHNFKLIAGQWRAGSHFLVFNNIYSKPYKYWDSDLLYRYVGAEMDAALPYRTFNCVYAAQVKAPSTNDTRIMNKFEIQRTGSSYIPGSLINQPFPAANEIRWLETDSLFISTDTASPDFLTPDWDNALVNEYIRDKGWTGASLTDLDGSNADLGAIPFSGRATSTLMIKPATPVSISGTGTNTKATIIFDLYGIGETIKNPKIKYIKWISNVFFEAYAWQGNVKILPANNIIDMVPQNISMGANALTFSVPPRPVIISKPDTLLYAFFELIIEGENSAGQKVTSSTGFMPYRKLDYTFVVEIWDMTQTKKLSEVQAGKPVKMVVTPIKIGSITPINEKISPVDVNLSSNYDLLDETERKLQLTSGIQGKTATTVIFTKVPIGGLERVIVNGVWKTTINYRDTGYAFSGSSDPVRILAGDPSRIEFQDPPSIKRNIPPTTLDYGINYNVTLQVYDKYDNKIDRSTTVKITSLSPNIGNITGLTQDSTNNTGLVIFKATVTDGQKDMTFKMVGTLNSNNATDTAVMKIGEPRNRLWVLLTDTSGFNPAVKLDGYSGVRYPVTIRASLDREGRNAIVTQNSTVEITSQNILKFYRNNIPEDSVPISQVKLVEGQAVVYVTSFTAVASARISVNAIDDNSLLSNNRDSISFKAIPLYIFYSDTSNYNPAVELRGHAGSRLPFVVKATTDGKTIIPVTTKFSVNNESGKLSFYASNDASSSQSIFNLTNGIAKLWAGSSVSVNNDSITARQVTTAIITKTRNRVYFDQIPLFILYSDTTDGLKPDARISGIAGERVPVTLRVSIDGRVISDNKNIKVTLSSANDKLRFFANGNLSNNTEISEVSLVNGQVKIWVTSYDSVNNGSISVKPVDDLSVAQNSRDRIFFTKPAIRVVKASAHADNGFGRFDRLELYYNEDLKKVPDSIEIYWPTRSDARKVIKNNITIDNNNHNHITVRLQSSFADAITSCPELPNNLGVSYYSNPALLNQPPEKSIFSIADSIGPLIKAATLFERLKPGDDTLMLLFSEQMNVQSLIGLTLSIIKTSLTVQITIKEATLLSDSTIRIVSKDALFDSPREGDSIKIFAAGPAKDLYNNRAHPLNRPVKLHLKPVAADIDSAFYKDLNADGVVDRIDIYFNKIVDISNVSLQATFNNQQTGRLESDHLTQGAESKIVQVDIKNQFTSQGIRTHGTMRIIVYQNDFPDNTREIMVSDRAAPVIESATYSPGSATGYHQFNQDTLLVNFSEKIDNNFDLVEMPFLFTHNTGGNTIAYTINLNLLQNNGNSSLFLITSIAVVKYPSDGDLVYLNTNLSNPVADELHNQQNNPDNNRALLKVKPMPYSLYIKIGPNPLIVGREKVSIFVDPNVNHSAAEQKIRSSVTIFDPMGNKVFISKPYESSSSEPIINIIWDGRNTKGRFVGAGTYIAVVKSENLYNRSKDITKLKIGVKTPKK
jgi:hypothetical protein